MTWPGRRPVDSSATWSPTVALLDTGLGEHPWFDRDVDRDPRLHGVPIGLRFDPDDDPERSGVTLDPVNRPLDPMAGHGTFIAGIVRAACPAARIVSVPVMYGDGSSDEADLIAALADLHVRHLLSLDGRIDEPPLDIVNLSLGYYHETPDSLSDEAGLTAALTALAAAGVTIVASAGNGGSDVEFWPAAATSPAGAPIVSVGSVNPGRATVSHFSNTGAWVRAYRPGAGIVSTMPTTFDASAHAAQLATGRPYPRRGTPDLDDFSGGFGLWSGTSFSAPLLAGELAAVLASHARGKDVASRSALATTAVTKLCAEGGP